MKRTWIRRLPLEFVVLAAFALCGRAPGQPTSAQDQAVTKGSPTPGELFKRLSPSVFVVESLDSKGTAIALGSAVAIGKDEVVTNRHVVEDGKSWRVRQGENTWVATIAFLDAEHDLCGLRVAGLQTNSVSLRLSSALSVGERVYALGAPEGLELSLSEGLISALRKFDGLSFIQTTAPISHGSSGGGLFDGQGKLIGVTTFTVKDGQNLNFAIPTDLIVGLNDHPATELHETVAERNASQAMLLSEVAQDAMESGDYGRALETSKQLVELRPEDPFLWSLLGELYLKLKQPDSAMEACQKAVRLGPGEASGWSCLGDVYEGLGQYRQAEDALKKAVDLDPGQEAQLVNLFSLGRVFAEEDKRIGVLGIYDRLKILDQNYADRFYKLVVEPILDAPHH